MSQVPRLEVGVEWPIFFYFVLVILLLPWIVKTKIGIGCINTSGINPPVPIPLIMLGDELLEHFQHLNRKKIIRANNESLGQLLKLLNAQSFYLWFSQFNEIGLSGISESFCFWMQVDLDFNAVGAFYSETTLQLHFQCMECRYVCVGLMYWAAQFPDLVRPEMKYSVFIRITKYITKCSIIGFKIEVFCFSLLPNTKADS